jgi:hypothetical protein
MTISLVNAVSLDIDGAGRVYVGETANHLHLPYYII